METETGKKEKRILGNKTGQAMEELTVAQVQAEARKVTEADAKVSP